MTRPTVLDAQQDRQFGLVVLFSREVDVSRIDPAHVFTLESPNPFSPGEARELGLRCRCPVAGRVLPVEVVAESNGLIEMAQELPGVQFAKAVAFVPEKSFPTLTRLVLERAEGEDMVVRIHGEFVVDADGRAVDAEFTRAELPTGDRPAGSPVGVQGGLFQSWFRAVVG